MKALILAAALLSLAVPAAAAEWRPEHPDRLAALDAEMAPLLLAYQPAFDAIVGDFTVMAAPWTFAGVAAAPAAMQARLDAAERLPLDIAHAKSLARDALSVMDRHGAPDACWADYAAVLRAGWLAYGDGADALEVGAMEDANRYVGAAIWLLGGYGTLVHEQSVADCAG